MKQLGVLLMLFGVAMPAHAADIAAGEVKAAACTACHGANGISVSADIPNLAGQKDKYLQAQLEAFRAGTRKNPFMNVMAGQLSDIDIQNLVAFFKSLPPATESVQSPVGAELARERLQFPANYKQDLISYTTINFPDRKQVRHYYANPVALQAARQGDPLPDGSVLLVEVFKAKLDSAGTPLKGEDGFFVQDTLTLFTAMERQPGWGDNIPEELRNENWQYAVFKADGTREGTNQARCLVCHKPKVSESYLFTLAQLTEKARPR